MPTNIGQTELLILVLIGLPVVVLVIFLAIRARR